MSQETLFEKILAGTIPCKKIYEDDRTFAFQDISPQAPVHVLVIPKTKMTNVQSANEDQSEILGRVLLTAKKAAEICGVSESGYRIVFNNGSDGGQTVPYLHAHVLGGRPLVWPPG